MSRPSVGQLVNNSSSAAAVAAALSTSSSLLHSGSLRCPRCNSPNTKFCYYNNRSHAQPRHFCRTCRRYWTQGGALRNVPIGGTSRRPQAQIHQPDPIWRSINGEPNRNAGYAVLQDVSPSLDGPVMAQLRPKPKAWAQHWPDQFLAE